MSDTIVVDAVTADNWEEVREQGFRWVTNMVGDLDKPSYLDLGTTRERIKRYIDEYGEDNVLVGHPRPPGPLMDETSFVMKAVLEKPDDWSPDPSSSMIGIYVRDNKSNGKETNEDPPHP